MSRNKKLKLVTSYCYPDLDGTACAIAYAEFLNKQGETAVAAFTGEIHKEAQYMFDKFGFEKPGQIKNDSDFEKVVLVDASDLNGLEGKIDPDKVVEIIDHRTVNEADKFKNAKSQIELVGSAATLIAEKFMSSESEISKPSATFLLGAIISNTLNFKGTVTTKRDKKAADWLNKTAQLPSDFWREIFLAKSDLSGESLEDRLHGDFAWFDFGKKVGIAQLEIIGVEQLLKNRLTEVLHILRNLKEEQNLDYIFLNCIELEQAKNYFVVEDEDIQEILAEILDIDFKNSVAERPNLIMRKQIVPLLKQVLT